MTEGRWCEDSIFNTAGCIGREPNPFVGLVGADSLDKPNGAN